MKKVIAIILMSCGVALGVSPIKGTTQSPIFTHTYR